MSTQEEPNSETQNAKPQAEELESETTNAEPEGEEPRTTAQADEAPDKKAREVRLPNIIWADGAYTNILGKTKPGKPAACPDDVREVALANLEAARAAGRAPIPKA